MRYLVEHPLPEGTTRENIEDIEKSIKPDKEISICRSYLNLSESRGYCVIDAPSRERMLSWFESNGMRADHILEVELESDGKSWVEDFTLAHAASQ